MKNRLLVSWHLFICNSFVEGEMKEGFVSLKDEDNEPVIFTYMYMLLLKTKTKNRLVNHQKTSIYTKMFLYLHRRPTHMLKISHYEHFVLKNDKKN